MAVILLSASPGFAGVFDWLNPNYGTPKGVDPASLTTKVGGSPVKLPVTEYTDKSFDFPVLDGKRAPFQHSIMWGCFSNCNAILWNTGKQIKMSYGGSRYEQKGMGRYGDVELEKMFLTNKAKPFSPDMILELSRKVAKTLAEISQDAEFLTSRASGENEYAELISKDISQEETLAVVKKVRQALLMKDLAIATRDVNGEFAGYSLAANALYITPEMSPTLAYDFVISSSFLNLGDYKPVGLYVLVKMFENEVSEIQIRVKENSAVRNFNRYFIEYEKPVARP
ncbi:hypothetical protein [Bdellovibrio bacteriovorus]|uniref:hypothetical protein n=1 Tax=Bdellovibrio TaxID=958 RepID=UPI0035A8DFCF